jgi:hypothetical protein
MTGRCRIALTRSLCCLGLLLVFVVGGCSRSATITGTVTYRGQPLKRGEINFIGADGKSRSGLIRSDGTYKVVDAPRGPVKVTVVSLTGADEEGKLSALGLGANSGPVDVHYAIPVKYTNPDESGLTYRLSRGGQKINIDLTD